MATDEGAYVEKYYRGGSVLLDRKGVVRAYDEGLPALARLLKLRHRQRLLNTKYLGLFARYPDVRREIARAFREISKVYSGADTARILKPPFDIQLRFFKGSDLILAQHFPLVDGPGRDVLDCLSDGVVVTDVSGDVIHHNKSLEEMLGPLTPFFLEKNSNLPEGYEVRGQRGQRAAESPIQSIWKLQCSARTRFAVIHPTGRQQWFRLDGRLRRSTSLPTGEAYFCLSNITREKHAEDELVAAQERLELATEGAGMGVWDWKLGRGEVVWNRKMYELFGKRECETSPGELWQSAIHPDDREMVSAELKRCLEQKIDVRADFRVVWEDGSEHYLRAQSRLIKNEIGEAVRLVGVTWDISSEVASEKRLQTMAYTDALTGLANRTTLMFRLNRAIARALRRKGQLGFLLLDLDNFKEVNDNFGHLVGDALLSAVVARLSPLVRDRDTFARLAGDEFAIVMESMVEPIEAMVLAHRLQDALLEPLYIERGPAITVNMSIGISLFPEDGDNAISLLKAADLAMYAAKNKGGSAVANYSPSMSRALNRKVELEYLLREAVRSEGFDLHFQPIVALGSGAVKGCEALIRWQSEAGRYVSPVDFIPLAEDCGLIPAIGAWVIETAFKQWLLWQRLEHEMEYISINVSPHQLYESEFSDELIATAARYGVKPSHIQLEITEGTFLQETKNTNTHLEKLVAAGFRLAIDDFGTGYSSLAYLKRFEVNVIKIDRSFIREIEISNTDREIVTAIVAMTTNLRLKALVEGVEEAVHEKIVTELGCDFAQGYYFGRPTFADEFAENYLK